MRWVMNLNGDSPETLIGELWDIYTVADKLRDKVADLTVNGRNYPNDPEDLRADQAERLEMIRKVEEVRRWAQNEMMVLKQGARK